MSDISNKFATGGYDMALCLSQKVINQQFQELMDDNTIHQAWSIRCASHRDEVVEGSVVVNEQQPGGDFPEDANPSYEELLEAFDKGIGLHEEQANKRVGFVAQVGAPYIQFIEDSNSQVVFCIPFTEGQHVTCFPYDNDPKVFKLAGAVFGFKVDLKKISRPFEQQTGLKNEVKVALDGAVESVIQQNDNKKGPELTAEDFLMESLFLAFENANFLTKDDYCVIPPSMSEGDWSRFSYDMADFCKHYLAGSEHPYVLGYNLTVPPVKPLPKAIFQPNCLYFSTTFVADQSNKEGMVSSDDRSSLNYLMMIGDHNKPTALDAGIVTRMVDNYDTLAINGEIFYHNFLASIYQTLINSVNSSLSNLTMSDFFAQEQILSAGGVGLTLNASIGSESLSLPEFVSFNKLMTEKIDLGNFNVGASSKRSVGSSRLFETITLSIDIVYSPSLVTEVNGKKLVITLYFNNKTTYKNQSESIGSWGSTKKNTDKATTVNSGEDTETPNIEITIYPTDDGKISVKAKANKANKAKITEGKQKVIDTVSKNILTPKPFSQLQSQVNLDVLASEINRNWPSALSATVLPNGNVFYYKAIEVVGDQGFFPKAGEPDIIDTVTFQSSYAPQFDL